MVREKNTFTVQIATVSEALFDGDAFSVRCQGVNGEITILPNHEPLVTRIEPSTIHVNGANGEAHQFPILGGVLEVAHNKAVLLCTREHNV